MDYKKEKFKKFSDSRGDLIVFLRESELKNVFKKFGQIYFVTFKKKRAVRGNHYHNKWHEWFGIVAGRVLVKLEDIKTKEQIEFILDSNHDRYIRLEIGPKVAHAFKSLTRYAALLNYADGEWYKEDTIKYELLTNK